MGENYLPMFCGMGRCVYSYPYKLEHVTVNVQASTVEHSNVN